MDNVRAKRADAAARYQAVRDAVLHWLHACYLTESGIPSIGRFTSTPFGRWYGQPFSDDEISKATRWLRERDLLRGQGSWQGGIIRPIITAKGIQMVESGRSVNAPDPSGGTTNNVTQTGTYNSAQAAGQGSTLSMTNTITDDHRQQALAFADLLEQSLPALNLPPAAAAIPDQLRHAAAQDDVGVMRESLHAAQLAMAGSVGSALGGVIFQHLHPLLVAFGLD